MGKSFLACAVLLTGAVFSSSAVEADSSNQFFGVGITVLKTAPATSLGIIYRNAVYTPGAVAIGLHARGYSHVNLISRDDSTYAFSAVSRSNGRRYLLTVAIWRGEIISAVRG